MNWENIGWKVRVKFIQLQHQVRPKDHMGILGSLLPEKYSPLRPNGDGLQSVYLAEIPQPFAEVLAGLIGAEAEPLLHQAAAVGLPAEDQRTPGPVGDDLDYWEHRLEQAVALDASIPETDRQAIVRSRRGQGLFKQRVLQHELRCRITGVDRLTHLVASHCKPWRDSDNEERLDGENGLLLTPSIDPLFDRGFIGFEDSGRLIISPVAHLPSLQKMGVETEKPVSVGDFTSGQKKFLDWHRDKVLLMAVR